MDTVGDKPFAYSGKQEVHSRLFPEGNGLRDYHSEIPGLDETIVGFQELILRKKASDGRMDTGKIKMANACRVGRIVEVLAFRLATLIDKFGTDSESAAEMGARIRALLGQDLRQPGIDVQQEVGRFLTDLLARLDRVNPIHATDNCEKAAFAPFGNADGFSPMNS